MCLCMYVYIMSVCAYVCVCVCECVCMYVCKYVRTYVCWCSLLTVVPMAPTFKSS